MPRPLRRPPGPSWCCGSLSPPLALGWPGPDGGLQATLCDLGLGPAGTWRHPGRPAAAPSSRSLWVLRDTRALSCSRPSKDRPGVWVCVTHMGRCVSTCGGTSEAGRDPQAPEGLRQQAGPELDRAPFPGDPKQRPLGELALRCGAGSCRLPGPSHQCPDSTEARGPAHAPALTQGATPLGPRTQNACYDSSPKCGGLTCSAGNTGIITVPGSDGARDSSRRRQDAAQQPAGAWGPSLNLSGHRQALPRDGHGSPGPTPSLGTWALPSAQTLVCPLPGQCSCPPSPWLTVL